MLIIGREIKIFCVSHPVTTALLSVPTGFLERVSVFIHQWRLRCWFQICWSLEALRLLVDRYCLSGFVFQLNMFAMNSRFRDHYKQTGLLCTEAGKSKRAQQKLQDRRVSRNEHFSRQRNLDGLSDDSDTHSKWRHFLLLGKIIAIRRLNLNNICSELLLNCYYLLLWFLYSVIFFGSIYG